ncbi:alpha/beta hydrolase [Janthinobacterium sp. BJB412]|nr:alpha/beta hydrolase [Janthinobacterium sp. BJB412]
MEQQLQIEGIDVMIEGEGQDTIVMLHGWPDTWRVWDGQVAALKGRYRCVRFTLPGFDIARPRRAYSLNETLAIIEKIVNQVSPGRKVTLMLHDWGCVFGYQFYMRHPQMVSRIVGVEIGDAQSPAHVKSLTLGAKLMVAWYQLTLAAAWKIGGAIGDSLTNFMLKVLRAPSPKQYISSAMNFPYYLVWTGGYGGKGNRTEFVPSCPMLYIYGTQKPFHFHSKQWTERLAARPSSQVAAFKTSHWVMLEQPQQFNHTVLAWLDASAAVAGAAAAA